MACPHGTTSAKWCSSCINAEREAERRANRKIRRKVKKETGGAAVATTLAAGYPLGYTRDASRWDLPLAVTMALRNLPQGAQKFGCQLITPIAGIEQTLRVDGSVSNEAGPDGTLSRYNIESIAIYLTANAFTADMVKYYENARLVGPGFVTRTINEPEFPCAWCKRSRKNGDKRPYYAVTTVPWEKFKLDAYTSALVEAAIQDLHRTWLCGDCARVSALPLMLGSEFSADSHAIGTANMQRNTDRHRGTKVEILGPSRAAHVWGIVSATSADKLPDYAPVPLTSTHV